MLKRYFNIKEFSLWANRLSKYLLYFNVLRMISGIRDDRVLGESFHQPFTDLKWL